jgi:hypothetical protein
MANLSGKNEMSRLTGEQRGRGYVWLVGQLEYRIERLGKPKRFYQPLSFPVLSPFSAAGLLTESSNAGSQDWD